MLQTRALFPNGNATEIAAGIIEDGRPSTDCCCSVETTGNSTRLAAALDPHRLSSLGFSAQSAELSCQIRFDGQIRLDCSYGGWDGGVCMWGGVVGAAKLKWRGGGGGADVERWESTRKDNGDRWG